MFEQRVNKKGFTYWQSVETGEISWENPHNCLTSISDGVDPDAPEDEMVGKEEHGNWTLYHNEDGTIFSFRFIRSKH